MSDPVKTLQNQLLNGNFSERDFLLFFEAFTTIGNQNEEIQEEVAGWNRTIEFSLNGSGTYQITIQDGILSQPSTTSPKPDLRVIMSGENAVLLFCGQKGAESALAAGEIKLEGDFQDAIKLAEILEIVIDEIEYS